ncbi:MAG: LamG domain-containing protein, partial [Candidatus Thorarchaeota archaeon]
GTPPQIKDSSSPYSNGSSYGIMTTSDQVSGITDGSLDFDGINDYIDFSNPSELQITGELTAQLWFRADGSIDDDYLIAKWGSSGDFGWAISFQKNATLGPIGKIRFHFSSDGSNIYVLDGETVNINQWYLVSVVFKPNEYAKMFLNGTQMKIMSTGVPPSLNNPSVALRIARRSDTVTAYFDGMVDEFRVSNIARSNDWILTEYNNQYQPLSFLSIGEEEVAKDVILADIQVFAIDKFGNFIPNVNVSMYSDGMLIRTENTNETGGVYLTNIAQEEYNFTVSMLSDIGDHFEIVNSTYQSILINSSFQIINLSCNVGTNFFEVEDVDGISLDSGWIVVGNSSHNLRNCTIDSYGKAKFWWVNTIPYEYNYTVYYQDDLYEPKIIDLYSGNINTANTTLPIQIELTTVDFIVLTIASNEPISGIKVKLRLDDISGDSIVNLTTNQNGIATLRWLTSSQLGGNYSIQLEFYGENKLFNNTIGGPPVVDEIDYAILSQSVYIFKIQISLGDYQTEIFSLNPSDGIIVNWGYEVLLRTLFNVTKAGGAVNLLGPIFADIMSYKIILGTNIIQTGVFSQEHENIGKHQVRLNTATLQSGTSYLIIISAQKSGYSLPSDFILQLSIIENDLVINQSENDDSTQSIYWLESVDMSVEPYGEASEDFTIQENLFQDESHNFMLSLPDLNNQWNLSTVIFNIYNISWTVGASDINLTVIDPWGQYYMFHASNHTGENYALGTWTGIVLNLNKNSPTLNNNFEFVFGGSFSGTIDIVADTYFIRDKIETKYVKFNITDSIRILTEEEGWVIKEIKFEIFNCYDTNNWSLINPLADAQLNITTNEGFKYSLNSGDSNGTGSLIINNLKIFSLSGEFRFFIESLLNTSFDVILYVDYIQEFYQNNYLETINSSIVIPNVINDEVVKIDVIDNGWIENSALLEVNGINNGISYFLPSELTMRITIGGQMFDIDDSSRGYGTFSLAGYNKDYIYSAIITTSQEVDFKLDYIVEYSRTVNYEVLGSVSFTIVQAPSVHGIVPYDSNLGCYLQTIDCSLIDADDYTIRFTVEKEHYISTIKDLQFTVLNRLTLINGSSDFFRTYQTIYVKDAMNLTFSYIDALSGFDISNLNTFSYIWESYDDLGDVIDSGEGGLIFNSYGQYILDFDTETRSVGEYFLIITLEKDNFDNRNAMVLLNIEKRIFNYTLGDNFKNSQTSIVKGRNLLVELRLLDLTKDNTSLENATIILTMDGIEYHLEEFQNGTYILTFPTNEIDAFFAPKILTGTINISKTDYISQEFEITIVVGMEEIFPGIPTFYFLLILIGIVSIAGSVTVYKVYKRAKIPQFVKRVRAIAKTIERETEISSDLLYREKEVYIGELVRENWDIIGLSLAEHLGVEISKTKKVKKPTIISEKLQEYTPIGLAIMRWNERIGTEIIAKYPEDINLSDKSLMQIYSTHEYSGDKGIVTLMDGALNLVSYYTGPDQGYYLILLLHLNDDPDAYESGMVDILQTILRNLQDDSYIKLLPSLFQRLSVFPSYNEEQMFYYT